MTAIYLREDVLTVLKIAFPMMISFFSEFSILLLQQIFVARIGNDELAAVAVANTWLNLPLYFIFGVATALETLASQAHGAGNKVGLIQHWMESVVSMTIFSVPLAVLMCVSKPIAKIVFGQPENIACLVALFCYWSLPGLVVWMFGTTIIKTLQAQNIIMVPAILTLFTFVIFIPIQIFLINYLGFIGSPIALTIVRFLWLVLLFVFWMTIQLQWWKNDDCLQITENQNGCIYTAVNQIDIIEKNNNNKISNQDTQNMSKNQKIKVDCDQNLINNSIENVNLVSGNANIEFKNFDEKPDLQLLSANENSDALIQNQNKPNIDEESPKSCIFTGSIIRRGIYQGIQIRNNYKYLKLGLAGGVMLLSEAFSIDVTTIFAARLGTDQVDAHISGLMICTVTFVTFPLSFAVAATILVGNHLGAKQPQKAKQMGIICVFLSTFSMFLSGIVMVIFRNQIGYVFSSDENIVGLIKSIIFPLVAFQLFDGIQSSCQGVLRGMGRQMQLFLFNMGGFWGGGVLVEVILCFVLGFGLQGIWWGIFCGVVVVSILTLIQLVRVDWEDEVKKIEKSESLVEDGDNENQDVEVDV